MTDDVRAGIETYCAGKSVGEIQEAIMESNKGELVDDPAGVAQYLASVAAEGAAVVEPTSDAPPMEG